MVSSGMCPLGSFPRYCLSQRTRRVLSQPAEGKLSRARRGFAASSLVLGTKSSRRQIPGGDTLHSLSYEPSPRCTWPSSGPWPSRITRYYYYIYNIYYIIILVTNPGIQVRKLRAQSLQGQVSQESCPRWPPFSSRAAGCPGSLQHHPPAPAWILEAEVARIPLEVEVWATGDSARVVSTWGS
jgi:hypothetical protein